MRVGCKTVINCEGYLQNIVGKEFAEGKQRDTYPEDLGSNIGAVNWCVLFTNPMCEHEQKGPWMDSEECPRTKACGAMPNMEMNKVVAHRQGLGWLDCTSAYSSHSATFSPFPLPSSKSPMHLSMWYPPVSTSPNPRLPNAWGAVSALEFQTSKITPFTETLSHVSKQSFRYLRHTPCT